MAAGCIGAADPGPGSLAAGAGAATNPAVGHGHAGRRDGRPAAATAAGAGKHRRRPLGRRPPAAAQRARQPAGPAQRARPAGLRRSGARARAQRQRRPRVGQRAVAGGEAGPADQAAGRAGGATRHAGASGHAGRQCRDGTARPRAAWHGGCGGWGGWRGRASWGRAARAGRPRADSVARPPAGICQSSPTAAPAGPERPRPLRTGGRLNTGLRAEALGSHIGQGARERHAAGPPRRCRRMGGEERGHAEKLRPGRLVAGGHRRPQQQPQRHLGCRPSAARLRARCCLCQRAGRRLAGQPARCRRSDAEGQHAGRRAAVGHSGAEGPRPRPAARSGPAGGCQHPAPERRHCGGAARLARRG